MKIPSTYPKKKDLLKAIEEQVKKTGVCDPPEPQNPQDYPDYLHPNIFYGSIGGFSAPSGKYDNFRYRGERKSKNVRKRKAGSSARHGKEKADS